MNKSRKVSVLMPVYNGAAYLKETIDSILNQTFTDFEFIIVDDCSTDNSVDIIKSYKDDRIVFVQNKCNIGISATRNYLMDLAVGEYYALTDNDDISLPTRFEKQVKYLDEHPSVGAVSCWQEYFPEYKLTNPKENYGFLDLLKWHPHIPHPCCMLRGDVFREHKIQYDDSFRFAEDYDLWFKLIRHSDIAIIQEVLFKYRWHGDNASIKFTDLQMKNCEKIKKKNLNFLTTDISLHEQIWNILYSNSVGANQDKSNNGYKIRRKNYKLFFIIPLIKIKYFDSNRAKVYLFGFIPLIEIKAK